MNIRKIKNKLRFLIESGYSYCDNGEKGLFHVLQFQKCDTVIAIDFDCYCEFLNLRIKKHTKVLIETSYDKVVIDCLNWDEKNFSALLRDIYALPRNSYSLSQEQADKLTDLYVDFIKARTGDGFA